MIHPEQAKSRLLIAIPDAYSGSLSCNAEVIEEGTTKVVADPLLDLLGTQLSVRLNYGTLSMNPVGLDRIEPRTLYRQQTGKNAYPTFSLGYCVVLPYPIFYLATFVPGGVIPNQKQSLLTLMTQLFTTPFQKGDGGFAYRTTIHESQ